MRMELLPPRFIDAPATLALGHLVHAGQKLHHFCPPVANKAALLHTCFLRDEATCFSDRPRLHMLNTKLLPERGCWSVIRARRCRHDDERVRGDSLARADERSPEEQDHDGRSELDNARARERLTFRQRGVGSDERALIIRPAPRRANLRWHFR